MNVLVTGSTGFIGSKICRALVAQGHQVRAFHRPNSSLLALEGLEVEHALGDVTEPETLETAVQGMEVIFHTAAQLGRPKDLSRMYAVTVGGTRNLLRLAAHFGVRRVVHTSSVAALGVPEKSRQGNPLLMDEQHTWNYRPAWWPYGHAKYQAELAVQEAVAKGLDVVIVNPAVVVGAGDLNRVSGDVLLHVARRRIPLAVAGGSNVVHIDDVVEGHLAALRRGRSGERYILSGENLSHLRFLQLISSVAGNRPQKVALPTGLVQLLTGPAAMLNGLVRLPLHPDMLRLAGMYFYYDGLKSRVELGTPTPRPVREAVAEALDWYRHQGWL